MNEISNVKMICGILMGMGILVFVNMLTDLLYKGILIGADALDAAIHQREKKDPRLLLYSELSGGINGLHGTALPITAALVIGAVYIRMVPKKESVLPVLLILLWGAAAACFSNIRYSIRCNLHTALFIKKFYAVYVSLQNREKAFDEACASIPDGIVKGRGISAGKHLARGMQWNSAVNELDDGTASGKGLVIFLKLFGKDQSDPDENAVNDFFEIFSEKASQIRNRMFAMKNAGLMLVIAIFVFSAVVVSLLPSGLVPVSTAVLIFIGILLAVMIISFRNICIDGRVL